MELGFYDGLGVMEEPNNLFYMRARHYDSQARRFISEDPIGFGGGINVYAYAGNNPVNYVDPSGLFRWDTFGYGVLDTVGGIGLYTLSATSFAAGQPLITYALYPEAGVALGFGITNLIGAFMDEAPLGDKLPHPLGSMLHQVTPSFPRANEVKEVFSQPSTNNNSLPTINATK